MKFKSKGKYTDVVLSATEISLLMNLVCPFDKTLLTTTLQELRLEVPLRLVSLYYSSLRAGYESNFGLHYSVSDHTKTIQFLLEEKQMLCPSLRNTSILSHRVGPFNALFTVWGKQTIPTQPHGPISQVQLLI